MYRFIKGSIFLFSLLILLTNCKKQFNEYYERPAGLVEPIYQQLEARGNFKHLLALIEKGRYKQTLASGGYWTLFAPNDSAFNVFFKERGISGINKMDSS